MKTPKTEQHQQGDVVIRRIADQTINGKKLHPSPRGYVLAEGEHTGHAHVLDCVETDAELIADGERILMRLHKTSNLLHEEHKPITLEPGLYEVGRVREKDWISGMVSPVQD